MVRSLRNNNHTLPSHLGLCSLFVASYVSQGLRWRYSNPPPHGVEVEVVVNLRLSQSASLSWCQVSIWDLRPMFLSPWEDGSVIYCKLLLDLARAVTLRSKSCRTAIFYCLIWDSPNLEGKVPIFISPRNRETQLYSRGTGFSFCHLLQLAGLRWRYSNHQYFILMVIIT
jgi:hypothetical protein